MALAVYDEFQITEHVLDFPSWKKCDIEIEINKRTLTLA